MSDLEKGGGRTWDHGAPAEYEGNGWDRFDEQDSASRSPSKAPSFDFQPSQLDAYRGTGRELIPLHAPCNLDERGRKIGKAPLRRGWRTDEPLTVDEAIERLRQGGNVGVRLSPVDLVIDIDPRNFDAGDDPVGRLEADFGFKLYAYAHVETGSGGSHYYMTIPQGLRVLDTLPDYPGIEFKSHGRQVVAAGSAHPETGCAYVWDDLSVSLSATPAAPDRLIDRIKRPERQAAAGAGEISAEQLACMLDGLDPCGFAEHTKWLQVLMACHHATAGDGRNEFIEWSTRDPRYSGDAELIGRRWDSLHADDGGSRITIGTLCKFLNDAGRADLLPKPSAEEDFANIGTDEPCNDDATIPKRRGIVDEWVYVIDAEQFVRRSDGKKWKKEQWKASYASLKPDGDVLNAIWRGNIPLRKFEALVYLPGQPEFPDGEAGGRYNIWRPSGVDASPGDVQPFLDHIAHLFPDEIERGYVLDYLAMLVQSPGRKINYALLVKGGQGTGKSWIGRLMIRIIGAPNVTLPSNTEVMSSWTVWTEGAQLAIIEELMCIGRLDMANRLKPIITEPMLRIESKGCSLYSIPNHLNLMAFTNHEDAVPIERGDRRWLVVFSDAKPRDEAYYDRLFTFLEGSGPSSVKQWLLDRRVALNPKGVAPRTKGKEEMRRLSLGEAEQWLAAALDESEYPFDFDLVRLEDLMVGLPWRQQKGYRNRVAKWLADEAGAVKHSRYTKGDRPAYWLWSIRNHERWAEAGAAERIDAYLQHEKETAGRIGSR